MALDPRILLQRTVPDIGPAVNTFMSALTANRDAREREASAPLRNRLLEAQTGQAEAQAGISQEKLTQERQLSRLGSVVSGAQEISGDLSAGNFDKVNQTLLNRKARLIEEGLPTETTDEGIMLLKTNPDELIRATNEIIQVGTSRGFIKAPARAGLASAKTEILADGSSVQVQPDGSVTVTNPSGQIVEGQDRLETLAQSRQFTVDAEQQSADIAVKKAQQIATATARAGRVSEVKKEQGIRKRQATRSQIKFNQALNFVDKADQGLSGAAKLQLARVFPSIDASNEAALGSSLKSLALDELQKFSGPTTDFEFGVTEDIAGSLGEGASANRARIKSLQRNNWFIIRESDQFNRYLKAGGDPDSFAFDFNEKITTKKGPFSLQDIQDTASNGNLSIEETLKRLNQ